jgi:hypothetical protein
MNLRMMGGSLGDTLIKLVHRFATRGHVAGGIGFVCPIFAGETRAHLLKAQPFPRAKAALTQVRLNGERQAARVGEVFGKGAAAREGG